MDWLHVSDQGVAADFIGNFFHAVLQFMPGETKDERCAIRYSLILAYYEAHGVTDRFDCMQLTFFEPKDGPYKLRGSAAKIRALVPFVWQLAQEILDINLPIHAAMRHAAFHLNDVYSAMSSHHADECDSTRKHGIKSAIQ